LVREAWALGEAEERLTARLELRVGADELSRDRMQALRELLGAYRGSCPVTLTVRIARESETVIALPDEQAVRPAPELVAELEALFGRPVAELAL